MALRMPVGLVNDEADSAFDNGLRLKAAPQYFISRGEDDTLQWEPPIRSRDLANALSYHYPLEQSLQEKMQHAILDFFEAEMVQGRPYSKATKTDLKPPETVHSPDLVIVADKAGTFVPKPGGSPTLQPQSTQGLEVFGVWDIKTGESVKPKGRKRGLSPTTRQRVAENRGNTCAYHRKAKTQCDPTQCRRNKLYPGTAAQSKLVKEADRGKGDAISTRDTTRDDHPVKRMKGLPTPPPNLPKSIKQLENARNSLNYQEFHRPSSKPSSQEESAHLSPIPSDYTNSFLIDNALFNSTEAPIFGLVDNVSGSSPGSKRISEGSKLFPSSTDMDISLELDPATALQLSFENNTVLQHNWPSAQETYGADNFNWIEDLMASDLPSLEYDWPREEAGATATLTDISSSPNTLFDFNYGFSGVDDLLGDFQNSQSSINQDFETENFAQSTGAAKSYLDKLADVLRADSKQETVSFARRRDHGSFSPHMGNVLEPMVEESRKYTGAAPDPPDVDWFGCPINSGPSLEAPTFAIMQEKPEKSSTNDIAGSNFANSLLVPMFSRKINDNIENDEKEDSEALTQEEALEEFSHPLGMFEMSDNLEGAASLAADFSDVDATQLLHSSRQTSLLSVSSSYPRLTNSTKLLDPNIQSQVSIRDRLLSPRGFPELNPSSEQLPFSNSDTNLPRPLSNPPYPLHRKAKSIILSQQDPDPSSPINLQPGTASPSRYSPPSYLQPPDVPDWALGRGHNSPSLFKSRGPDSSMQSPQRTQKPLVIALGPSTMNRRTQAASYASWPHASVGRGTRRANRRGSMMVEHDGQSLAQSKAERETLPGLLSGDISSDVQKGVISIDELTTLLLDSGLKLSGPINQVYFPKDEPSLVDIMLLDGVEALLFPDATTPRLNDESLRDVLSASHSKARLIESTCNLDVQDSYREALADQSSPDISPPALKTGSLAKHVSLSRNSSVEYIRSVSNEFSSQATADSNGERQLTIIYRFKASKTVVRRAMIVQTKATMPSLLSPSYILRWLDPNWRSIESMIPGLNINKNLSPRRLNSAKAVDESNVPLRSVMSYSFSPQKFEEPPLDSIQDSMATILPPLIASRRVEQPAFSFASFSRSASTRPEERVADSDALLDGDAHEPSLRRKEVESLVRHEPSIQSEGTWASSVMSRQASLNDEAVDGYEPSILTEETRVGCAMSRQSSLNMEAMDRYEPSIQPEETTAYNVAARQSSLYRYGATVQLEDEVAIAHVRRRSKLGRLFEKPVDALKALWTKMGKLKL